MGGLRIHCAAFVQDYAVNFLGYTRAHVALSNVVCNDLRVSLMR